MPECLQPERLIRRYGLKTNVIRALYHMYQPFVNRIKPITTFEEHPECLKSYECHLVWHTTKSSNFIYFFKMRRKTFTPSLSHSRTRSEVPDLLEILDDISANPDEHCRVLQVSCLHFCPVPPTLGTFTYYCLSYLSKIIFYRFGPKIGLPHSVFSSEIPISQVAAGVRYCGQVIVKLTRGR